MQSDALQESVERALSFDGGVLLDSREQLYYFDCQGVELQYQYVRRRAGDWGVFSCLWLCDTSMQ